MWDQPRPHTRRPSCLKLGGTIRFKGPRHAGRQQDARHWASNPASSFACTRTRLGSRWPHDAHRSFTDPSRSQILLLHRSFHRSFTDPSTDPSQILPQILPQIRRDLPLPDVTLTATTQPPASWGATTFALFPAATLAAALAAALAFSFAPLASPVRLCLLAIGLRLLITQAPPVRMTARGECSGGGLGIVGRAEAHPALRLPA